ncbi:MAG TPA: hypothetical protein VF744_09865 [Beijerinckiaceae bacterium]|jgi:hypothetical protein
MDWLTFFSSVIKSVAWPAVVVALLVILRKQLQDLASDLDEFSFPGGSAKFKKRLQEAKKEIDAAGEEESQPKIAPPTDEYLELATKYPQAAILQAFEEVAEAAREYRRQFPNAGTKTTLAVMKGLYNMKLIDRSVLNQYRKLRDTRNAAVHAQYITPGEAIEYRTLCRSLAERVRVAIATMKKDRPDAGDQNWPR